MNPEGSLAHAPLEDAAYARLSEARLDRLDQLVHDPDQQRRLRGFFRGRLYGARLPIGLVHGDLSASNIRSEEHTSELQSLMRISYAVFCLTKKQSILPHSQSMYLSTVIIKLTNQDKTIHHKT